MDWLRKTIIIAGVLVAVGTVAYLMDPRSGTVVPGSMAPSFVVADMKGGPVRFADFKGKLVLLNFWATWCPPCIQELPSMAKLNDHMRDSAFAMMAICVDAGGAHVVERLLNRLDLSLPIYLDPGSDVSALYGVFRFPETFLISKDGIVLDHFQGAVQWDDAEIVGYLKQLLADNAVADVHVR